MTNTTRTSTSTVLVLAALIALLLALLGGTAATANDIDEPGDDPTCTPEESDDSGDASTDSGDDDSGDDESGDDDAGDDEDCDEDDDEPDFDDVKKNARHRDGIAWLRDTGITNGCKEGKFCPNKPVTRGEFATLAGRMLGEVDGVEAVAAPADEVEAQIAELQAQIDALQAQIDAFHPGQ